MKQRTDKIIARIDALAAISEDGAVLTRRYGTPAAVEAGRLVMQWMQDAGLETRIDAVGNLRARWPSVNPTAKTLVIGSHLDTVVNAGRWDGPLGVLAGLDILENIAAAKKQFPFSLELIAFCDEEGVRFHTTYLGSKVVAGNLDAEVLHCRDQDGTSVEEAIRSIGGDPDKLLLEAIPADRWLGYFELHIEQGPVLYDRRIPAAPVTAIAGQIRGEIIFTGMAGHAGTVPMAMRQDALCGAAEFIMDAERTAADSNGFLLATVGKLLLSDAASNVIPGRVTCTIDIRSADPSILETGYARLKTGCEAIAARRGLAVEWKLIQSTPPVRCDTRMKDLLAACIRTAGYEALELVSGAGHDAVPIAAVSPVCMLFVRCHRGISHNPLENVEKEDLAAALAIAEDFIFKLAEK